MAESSSPIDTNITEPEQPAGYCPNCEYQMNAGVCPECGKHFNTAQLDKTPRTQRRQRRRRTIGLLTLSIGLLYGGSYLYQSRFWYKWLPFSMLINFPSTSAHANDELFERYEDGVLSAPETQQLIARCINLTAQIRSPRPQTESFVLQLDLDWRQGFMGPGSHLVTDPTVTVDGAPASVQMIAEQDHQYTYRCVPRSEIRRGTVTADVSFTVVTNVSLTPTTATGMFGGWTTACSLSGSVTVQQQIQITDRPVDSYVRPARDQLTAFALQEKCAISICPRSERSFVLNLCVKEMDAQIAGTFAVHLADGEERLGRRLVQTAAKEDLATLDLDFEIPDRLEPQDTTVNVSFTPDIMYAFEHNLDHCAGFTIEWVGVPLPVPGKDDCDVCNCCNKPFIRSPDFVKKWQPQTGD